MAAILLFWDWPVGYGRKPQSIFWFALPFIIFGAVVLDPRYLEGIGWPQKNKLYEWLARLLLSVDKFTPKLMEFGLEDKWQPPKLSGFMQFFLHVYKIMGKVFLSYFLSRYMPDLNRLLTVSRSDLRKRAGF